MAFFNIDRVETGNRIVKRRKAMGLSRDRLADCLWGIGVEVSITSIGKWERGECDISEEHARALCRIFGCKPCELIVARLSFYDDERDQLVPLIITYFHILTSICLRRCSSFCFIGNSDFSESKRNTHLPKLSLVNGKRWIERTFSR